ncbi:MAG: peptidase M23 [Helicobacteraceae bacterium CG2_30_36_10]|nr:MAG: peptidase M23 [Helicobacteraceae bacterium CG2_30_36_10]
MNNLFTVTIHDTNGLKQFNLHYFIKKALLYAAAFLGVVGLIAVATILYLDYLVDEIDKKRSEMEVSYANLQSKNLKLDQHMLNTQKALDRKKEELNEVSDSLLEIEEMIGLSNATDVPLIERVNKTKLDSQQMATLLQFIPSGSPIEYKGITSKFGYRIHPTLGTRELHRGSDMRAAMRTPVYATADGIVEYAGLHNRSGYGRLIILQHNYGFKTYFGHLNEIVIKSGQFIKKGDLLAYTGNTGMSNGPHLHYEVRFISRTVNPFWFIKWNIKNYNEIFEKENKIPWQSLLTATARLKVQRPIQTQLLSQQDQ